MFEKSSQDESKSNIPLVTGLVILAGFAVHVSQTSFDKNLLNSLEKSEDFNSFLSLVEKYNSQTSSSSLTDYVRDNSKKIVDKERDIAASFNIEVPVKTYDKMLEVSEIKKLLSAPNSIENGNVNVDLSITSEITDSLEKALKFYKNNYQYFRGEPEMLMNGALKAAGIPKLISNELSGVFEMNFVEKLESKETNNDGSVFHKK